MTDLLTVRDLRVASGERELLHGVDLSLGRGERVGVIGESGSGKSLTCLSIMGLLPETLTASGSIELDGAGQLLGSDPRAMARLRGQRISMVFQEPMTALDPLMRVGTQVADALTIHLGGDRRAAAGRAVELLDGVRIPEPARAARAYPHQLSGGQRQRVMLAMAMANTPDLLLADEPTTALDATVQSQVLDLMRVQVRDAGTSLLFITHDLGIVASLCERVVILRDGSVVEEGDIDRVFSRPQHPYTRGLLAASALETDSDTGRLRTVLDLGPVEDDLSDSPRTHPPAARQTEPSSGPHDAAVEPGTVFNLSTAEGPPLIQVRNLVRTYSRSSGPFARSQQVQALRGVSFDVRAGQRFGIVGESGSGKSTLLRLLTGLDDATSGSIRIGGDDVVGVPERRLRWLRRVVQIVFQDPMGSLDPRMRIRDVVAEPLRGVGRGERRARVEELMDAVGLPRSAVDRFPHQFSGGQRQRIAIARALVTRPDVLVADEAVSALDTSVRAQVLNLLQDLVEEYALTMVFVSHDLHVVRHVCDTIAVMSAGEILECGPAEAVLDSPIHPYTAALVAATPALRMAT